MVLAKYGAAYLFYLALWASTGGFFALLWRFTGDSRLIDPGPIAGGYLFVAVSGLFFIGVGVFASALSRNQAVAGILAFTFLAAIVAGGHYLARAPWMGTEALSSLRAAASYADVFAHYEDFTRGVVDTRHLLFYASGTVLSLIFSILAVEARILHG